MAIRDVIKNYPYAIDFSAPNGGIIIANSPSLNMTDYFAIERKVYVVPGKSQVLIDNSTLGVTNSYYLSIGPDGTLSFYSTIGGSPANILNIACPIKYYAFNDFAIAYNGSRLNIMANGRVVATASVTGAFGVNTGPLRLNQYWSGAVPVEGLDVLTRMYHTNAYTVKDHQRTVNNKEPTASLSATCVLNLDYSAGSGTSLPDLSGNGNAGVFARGVWSTITPSKSRNTSPARNAPDRNTTVSRNPIVDPENISAIYKLLDIQADLNPELLTSLADGALVDTLIDGSGYGRNATASGSLRPTLYKTTASELLNGKPTLKFNGNNAMTIASGLPTNPGVTIIIIGKSNSGAASNYFADGYNLNRRVIYRTGGQVRLYAGNNVLGDNLANATYGIITAMFNSANSNVGVNYKDYPGDCGVLTDVGITLGNSSGASSGVGLLGSIARVIIANGVNYSTDILSQVRAILSNYYNI